MIRSKSEAGTGVVSTTVTDLRTTCTEIHRLGLLTPDEPNVSRGLGEAMADIYFDESRTGSRSEASNGGRALVRRL